MRRSGVAIALAIAVMLAGCSSTDGAAAREFAGSWAPGGGVDAIDCADLGLAAPNDARNASSCFVVRQAGDASELTQTLLDDLLASAGDSAAPDRGVTCAQEDDATGTSCAATIRYDGASVVLGVDYSDDFFFPETPEYDARYRISLTVVD